MLEDVSDTQPGVVSGGVTDPLTGDVPAGQPAISDGLNARPERHTDPSLKDQQVPDVQPGSIASNRMATYVPDSAKPVHGAEFNPGGPEYGVHQPDGPAGTDAAIGSGASRPGKGPVDSNHHLPGEGGAPRP